ncbi:hypothetical protein J6P92_00625 [bacterium]|nr:hypothetical protein [bacterium]
MLVSSIARFDAVNTMNNAAFASVQNSNNMVSAVKNVHAFGGDYESLNDLDNRLSLSFLTNALSYKIAFLQEKMFAKKQKDEFERNRISYIA